MKWIAVFKERTGEKLNGAVNVTINQLTSALKKLDEQLPTWSERNCVK